MDIQRAWQAVEQEVCSMCPDGNGEGGCRRHPAVDCAIRQYFPLICNAVLRILPGNRNEYVRELRAIVCAQCRHQGAQGYCSLRSQVDCAVERRFEFVVEAIESALEAAGA